MKILFQLIFLSLFLNCIYSGYVKVQYYQINDYTCKNEMTVIHYRTTDLCNQATGIMYTCDAANNNITRTQYYGTNCQGGFESMNLKANTCSNDYGTTSNVKYSCSEDYDIGSDSIVNYLTNGQCPDSDPNWKEDIIQVASLGLNECTYTAVGSIKTTSCNDTSYDESYYLSNDSCPNAIFSHSIPFPECDKQTPEIYYCNS
ncbi:hypothetical protein RB653_010237 [Dictyostelium firmibasis]|uniref:Uncharacterized protein n=1 Tax=Dictyostelium firmibasis TaxID=79012 RepID=A0AAN7TJS5_9MYCE